MSEKGFHSHIQEAIKINKGRKIQYAGLSRGRTKSLSNVLITSEILTRPIARYYDNKAKPFNSQGIMVVKEDFVDMDIPPYNTKVKYQSAWSKAFSNNLKALIVDFLKTIPKNYRSDQDIESVLSKGRKCYGLIEAMEKKYDIHCAMTKHMLESICFIGMNGIQYSKQSDGATLSLSGSIINWHKVALKNSLWMDKWANKFHQKNIGILVNDMPHIPIY